jgi:hypothetical protein
MKATGGELSKVTEPDAGDAEYLFPSFLPDGIHFLYLLRNYADEESKRELRVGSIDGDPHKSLMRINSNAIYAPTGELVWWQDGNLRAQPFDLERLELTGESRVVRSGVQFDPRVGLGMFSVSSDGTLVYREGGVVSGDELARFDRDGNDLGAIGPPGNFYHPRLSPDGSMVVVDRSDETNRGDIWIHDAARGTGTRLTSAPEDESTPVWSPDGRQIAFFSAREVDKGALHIRSLRGVDDEKMVYAHPDAFTSILHWSSGKIIIGYRDPRSSTPFYDLGVYSIDDDTFEPVVASRFTEFNGSFSPDGRFLAFDSDETGRTEVYVQPYPDPVDRWRVSSDGGSGGVWRSDGRELFFVQADSTLVSVRVSTDGANLTFGEPETLFHVDLKPSPIRQVDTIDGETFIVNRTVGDADATPLTVVVNEFANGKR